jgi:hypothetical protein
LKTNIQSPRTASGNDRIHQLLKITISKWIKGTLGDIKSKTVYYDIRNLINCLYIYIYINKYFPFDRFKTNIQSPRTASGNDRIYQLLKIAISKWLKGTLGDIKSDGFVRFQNDSETHYNIPNK